jgi:phage protein D
MAGSSYRLVINGSPVEDSLHALLAEIEVEENVDLPGALQLSLPVGTDGHDDLTFLNDARFAPFAPVSLVAQPEGGTSACIFDGCVLSHKAHLDAGTMASTLQVWAQDASYLMNLEEKARAWADMTDGAAANAIFGEYGITPAPENTSDDSPSHTEDGHILMQRGTDIQFLRQLARRSGKLCRVTCEDTPGVRTGYFARPSIKGEPKAKLSLNDPDGAWTVNALDFSWDVMRPTKVTARQATRGDSHPDGAGGDTTDGGLASLDARGLSAFAGRDTIHMLAAPVDDAGELTLRAKAFLRDAGWFVRCEGETDVGRLGSVLRAGTVVSVERAGSLYSGKYFVWSVRHTLTRDAHKMRFTLMRNALGPAASG